MNKKQKSIKVKTTGYWNAPFKKREKDNQDVDLSCLVGKKIVAVGRLDTSKFLPYTASGDADYAIDYQDGKVTKRIIIESCEGWGIAWSGFVGTASHADSLRSGLNAIWDDLPMSDDLKIAEKPTERRYSFVGPKGKEAFSLNIEDIKCMPESVRKHFTSSEPKNVQDIIFAMSAWVLSI